MLTQRAVSKHGEIVVAAQAVVVPRGFNRGPTKWSQSHGDQEHLSHVCVRIPKDLERSVLGWAWLNRTASIAAPSEYKSLDAFEFLSTLKSRIVKSLSSNCTSGRGRIENTQGYGKTSAAKACPKCEKTCCIELLSIFNVPASLTRT